MVARDIPGQSVAILDLYLPTLETLLTPYETRAYVLNIAYLIPSERLSIPGNERVDKSFQSERKRCHRCIRSIETYYILNLEVLQMEYVVYHFK